MPAPRPARVFLLPSPHDLPHSPNARASKLSSNYYSPHNCHSQITDKSTIGERHSSDRPTTMSPGSNVKGGCWAGRFKSKNAAFFRPRSVVTAFPFHFHDGVRSFIESTFPTAAADSGSSSLPAWGCSCSSVNRSTTTSEIIEAPVNLFSKGT